MNILSKDHQMLAATLAEKLAFRVSAFVKWVSDKNITIDQLITMHRRLHDEGGSSKFASEILIAFVNNLPANTIV